MKLRLFTWKPKAPLSCTSFLVFPSADGSKTELNGLQTFSCSSSTSASVFPRTTGLLYKPSDKGDKATLNLRTKVDFARTKQSGHISSFAFCAQLLGPLFLRAVRIENQEILGKTVF